MFAGNFKYSDQDHFSCVIFVGKQPNQSQDKWYQNNDLVEKYTYKVNHKNTLKQSPCLYRWLWTSILPLEMMEFLLMKMKKYFIHRDVSHIINLHTLADCLLSINTRWNSLKVKLLLMNNSTKTRKTAAALNSLSANPTKWSNTLKQFAWVCLDILSGWSLQS